MHPTGVELDTTVEEDRTVITVDGTQAVTVVVRTAAGERIYLPPDDFSEEPADASDSPYKAVSDDSPYKSSRSDSPYRSSDAASDDSPYQGARDAGGREQRKGQTATADGFRIVHSEPAEHVEFFR